MEIAILAVIAAFLIVRYLGLKRCAFDYVRYDQKVMSALGIRHLTFEKKSDVAIAISLVAAFLAAILLMGAAQ